MTIRKKACKAFARNFVVAMVENCEITWQTETYVLSEAELEYMQQELKKIAHKIIMTIDFDALKDIKEVE